MPSKRFVQLNEVTKTRSFVTVGKFQVNRVDNLFVPIAAAALSELITGRSTAI